MRLPVLSVLACLLAGTSLVSAQTATPTISPGGVVNAADYTPAVAPGMLIAVFGDSMASKVSSAAGTPLPTALDGTSVEVNGQAIPLFFVSPKQINAQMPFGISGQVQVRVRTPAGLSAPATVTMVASAPRLFTKTMDGKGEPILVHNADWSLVSAASPARPGEYLILFLTGLGAVSPAIPAGQAGGDSGKYGPLNQLPAGAVTIDFGGKQAAILFAGLAPGWVGLYQINFQAPTDLPPGLQTLTVKGGGSVSQNLVSANTGSNQPQVASGTVGASGGTVAGPGISLNVPAGALSAASDIKIYSVNTSADSSGQRLSPIFKLDGLPLVSNSPITLTLDLATAPAAGESVAIVVQTEKPLRGDGYHLFPATLSGNRVTVSLPALKNEVDIQSNPAVGASPLAAPAAAEVRASVREAVDGFSLSANVSVVLRPLTIMSSDAHFRISYWRGEISAEKAAAAGPVLETAYKKLAALGLDWSIRKEWPIDVYLRDLTGSEGFNWGEQSTSYFWGINGATIKLNSKLLASQGITADMRGTVGHELFHLMQEFYDPRNRWDKSHQLSPWAWYFEALSTWFESIMLEDDSYIPSTVAADNWAFLTTHGLEFPPGTTYEVTHHGYGASMFLRFLAAESGDNKPIASVLKRMAARTQTWSPMPLLSPVAAMKMDFPGLSGAWLRFGRAFAARRMYGGAEGFPSFSQMSVLGRNFSAQYYVFDSLSKNGLTFQWDAPDLSVRAYTIDFRQTWDAGTKLKLVLTDPSGDAEATVYRKGPGELWEWLGDFTGTLEIPNVEKFAPNKEGLAIFVTQGRAVPPYTGTSPVSLEVKMVGAPFRVITHQDTKHQTVYNGTFELDRTISITGPMQLFAAPAQAGRDTMLFQFSTPPVAIKEPAADDFTVTVDLKNLVMAAPNPPAGSSLVLYGGFDNEPFAAGSSFSKKYSVKRGGARVGGSFSVIIYDKRGNPNVAPPNAELKVGSGTLLMVYWMPQ
jgi:uncharacterized protein (TIGR03437 family)